MREFVLESTESCNGDKLHESPRFTFEPRLTVLIGCNGCGKALVEWAEKQIASCSHLSARKGGKGDDGGNPAAPSFLGRVFPQTAGTGPHHGNRTHSANRSTRDDRPCPINPTQ